MTIAPEVLEELDFPTPEITPGAIHVPAEFVAPPELFDKLNTLLAELVELVLPGLTEAFAAFARAIEEAQIPLLDASKINAGTIPQSTFEHYCWCSPSRGMLFSDDDVTLIAHTWFGDTPMK